MGASSTMGKIVCPWISAYNTLSELGEEGFYDLSLKEQYDLFNKLPPPSGLRALVPQSTPGDSSSLTGVLEEQVLAYETLFEVCGGGFYSLSGFYDLTPGEQSELFSQLPDPASLGDLSNILLCREGDGTAGDIKKPDRDSSIFTQSRGFVPTEGETRLYGERERMEKRARTHVGVPTPPYGWQSVNRLITVANFKYEVDFYTKRFGEREASRGERKTKRVPMTEKPENEEIEAYAQMFERIRSRLEQSENMSLQCLARYRLR